MKLLVLSKIVMISMNRTNKKKKKTIIIKNENEIVNSSKDDTDFNEQNK